MSLAFAPSQVRQGAPDQQATVQKLLDENSQLITKIKECHDQGRAEEAVLHQQLLHRNLMMLAKLADHSLLNQLKEDIAERPMPNENQMALHSQHETTIQQPQAQHQSSTQQQADPNQNNPSISQPPHSSSVPPQGIPSGSAPQQPGIPSHHQPGTAPAHPAHPVHQQLPSQMMPHQYPQNPGQGNTPTNQGLQYSQMVMPPQPYGFHHQQGMQPNPYQGPGGYVHHDLMHQSHQMRNPPQGQQPQNFLNLPR